ncbi:MAG: hypothetical protein RMJ44_09205 [Cytophagales bacterium]|nr:hypothetical protein [Bernardetiaceae bacterium]MDW8211252.1 hypothetical protein [Cytophagales bacterium]
MVVDTLGLLHVVMVTGAEVKDAQSELELLPVLENYRTLQRISPDKVYVGEFLESIEWIDEKKK